MAVAPHPHVELVQGVPRVRGSNVPVYRLWQWHRKGVTVHTLVKRYPSLGWSQVLDALSYAYDNQDLMAEMERRETAARFAKTVHPQQLPLFDQKKADEKLG